MRRALDGPMANGAQSGAVQPQRDTVALEFPGHAAEQATIGGARRVVSVRARQVPLRSGSWASGLLPNGRSFGS